MRDSRLIQIAALCAMVAFIAFTVAGCGGGVSTSAERIAARNAEDCGGSDCHQKQVDAQQSGKHWSRDCHTCHTNVDKAHADDPENNPAVINWTVEACRPCHEGETSTYLYDDNAKAGPFGGSISDPPQPKTDTFPQYNTIIAGHGFTKEYNEEGAHARMLESHYGIKRKKAETCVQCKSTKIALAWLEGKPVVVATDTVIALKHEDPPKKVTIPAGTTLTYLTDARDGHVEAKAQTPDGQVYTSVKQADGATDPKVVYDPNMLWAATIAATKDTMPYGAGCNHCHDPHTGESRLVRQALIRMFKPSENNSGTVNPYSPNASKDFEDATKNEKAVMLCAQCHVEYTCGISGVDGIDRDTFGWAKAKDLDRLYEARYGYKQDWLHAGFGKPLIKSQHPETELFWSSEHYAAGADCVDCHMPRVRQGNRIFRSHWLTSPFKYEHETLWKRFQEANGLDSTYQYNPCTQCHEDRIQRAARRQRAFYARQGEIEQMLAGSVRQLTAIKKRIDAGGKVDTDAFEQAYLAHRKAHVLWENIAVSENSMGFHNYKESMAAMDEAEKHLKEALANERKALGS